VSQTETIGKDVVQNQFRSDLSQSEPTSTDRLGEPIGIAAMASMLLGLKLRGHLTDSEAEWLDMLAPDRWRTILVDGDDYLHPTGVTLLPRELINGDWQNQSDAVFSRRIAPDPGSTNGWHRLHTAVIRRDESRPMVLGFWGPEEKATDQSAQGHFFTIVDLFRQANREVEDSWSEIEAMLSDPAPTLLVNRNSGRVLATNPAVHATIGDRLGNLVDSEYGKIRAMITSMGCGRSIRMRNFRAAGLEFCLVRWPMQEDAETKPAPNSRKRLVDPAECLSRIIWATQLLHDSEDLNLTPHQQKLLEEIFEAASVLANGTPVGDDRMILEILGPGQREL
jgi:hypothetical protein